MINKPNRAAARVKRHYSCLLYTSRAQKHALKFVAVVENLTDRKVPAEQDRAPSVPLSGLAVALYSLPSPEIIPSS